VSVTLLPLTRYKDYRTAAARFLAALSKIDGDCVIKLDVDSVAEALRVALKSTTGAASRGG
jgi:hypothetical protein